MKLILPILTVVLIGTSANANSPCETEAVQAAKEQAAEDWGVSADTLGYSVEDAKSQTYDDEGEYFDIEYTILIYKGEEEKGFGVSVSGFYEDVDSCEIDEVAEIF